VVRHARSLRCPERLRDQPPMRDARLAWPGSLPYRAARVTCGDRSTPGLAVSPDRSRLAVR
jgi:hypothetical protein